MAISRARKEDWVALYTQKMVESQALIFAHYSGLSVKQMQALRRAIREQEGEIFVVKNTLLRDVINEQGLDVPEDFFTGPTLAAFCYQEAPPVAKMFRDFAKEYEGHFNLRGSLVEGNFYSAEQTKALADMPGRDELFGMLLGTINAPATQMAGVVASGIRQILNVVQAYVDKLEGGDSAPAEAAA